VPSVTYCHDLGVTITSDWLPTQYITEIVSKARRRANCILRSYTSGDIRLLLRAHVVYVRPLVEYKSIIWSLCAQHDTELLKKFSDDSLSGFVGCEFRFYPNVTTLRSGI